MQDDLPSFDYSFLKPLQAAFDEYSERVCCQMGDSAFSYGDVEKLSAKVANQLRADGLIEGDKAAVFSLNSPEAFVATIGIIRAGGVWVPVNPRNSMAENLSVLEQFGVRFLFFQESFSEAAAVVAAQPGSLCVSFDDGESSFPLWTRWVARGLETAPATQLSGDSLLSIPLTGGTSGKPRGVMLTHRCFSANAYNLKCLDDRPDQVWLCAAPMTHVGGRLALCAMASGARLVILERVDLDLVLETIERERITDLFLPPTAVYSLLDHPRLSDFDLSSLQQLGYGSAPMNTQRLKQALEVLGPVMRGGFGQTECPMSISSLAQEDHFVDGKIAPDQRLRSVGRETPVSMVRIMGEDGELLPAGEAGEIVVKGPTVCAGYYRNPEGTAGIRRNGWHLTGDIGYLDDDGFLYIVDRKKDMIITGGFNVYSAEVEQYLASLPGVAHVAVVGLPDDKWGELVTAVIVPESGADLNADEIIAGAKAALGGVKAPKRIEIQNRFPLTNLGKIDKKSLRRMLTA